VVGPLLVLDLHLRAGRLGEPGVGVVDDVLPAGLGVDHEPDLERLALAVDRGVGVRGAAAAVRAARGGEQRGGERRGNRDLALHASS
jgi:hypothetical protein